MIPSTSDRLNPMYGYLLLLTISSTAGLHVWCTLFDNFAVHVFFNFALRIRTFFQKIADPEDIAPSMAVGFTINNIAAVFLPFIGGMLWLVDYRPVFFTGAALSLGSLVLVQGISSQLRLSTNVEG